MSQAPIKNNGDDELMWVIFGGLFLLVAVWFIGHEKISAFVMKVRSIEAYLLIFDREAQDAIREWLATTTPKEASLKGLWESGMAAGRTLRFLVFAIVTGLFAYLVIRSPDRSAKFTQTYTTASLALQESALWSVIKPVLGIGIDGKSLDDPIHGMRARPRDYGRKHGFIVRIASLGIQASSANVEILDEKDALILDRAKAIFAKQLGKPWQGVNMMRIHERCLFAAFAAQINNDNALSQLIVNDLAKAYVRARSEKNIKKIVSANAEIALEKYGNSKPVQKIASRHAFERTVLVSMLQQARVNGVLPPNWFRWLKTVDRVAWYALCDLGLDVASVEAAGVRNHWLAETRLGAPIVEPMVESALSGLKSYLGEIVDEEIED